MFASSLERGRFRCWLLHHHSVLVHGFHFFCQSRGHSCPLIHRHVFRHSAIRCSRFHGRTTCRGTGSNFSRSLARARFEKGRAGCGLGRESPCACCRQRWLSGVVLQWRRATVVRCTEVLGIAVQRVQVITIVSMLPFARGTTSSAGWDRIRPWRGWPPLTGAPFLGARRRLYTINAPNFRGVKGQVQTRAEPDFQHFALGTQTPRRRIRSLFFIVRLMR